MFSSLWCRSILPYGKSISGFQRTKIFGILWKNVWSYLEKRVIKEGTWFMSWCSRKWLCLPYYVQVQLHSMHFTTILISILCLLRLTENQSYLYKAIHFYKFMDSATFQSNSRPPDNPYSLYEGIAGTVCFLGDLLCPENASFPFSDIF